MCLGCSENGGHCKLRRDTTSKKPNMPIPWYRAPTLQSCEKNASASDLTQGILRLEQN